MKYGYARVSTDTQDLQAQVERLEAAGCHRVFAEKLSGKNANRPQLQRLLRLLRAGDVLLAVNSDRIARDPFDMLTIFRHAKTTGARLALLDEPFIDTTSEVSDLLMFLMGWVAKWHRRRILENTAQGRARARARGVKFGRKPKMSQRERQDAVTRLEAGEPKAQVAEAFKVSGRTIDRLCTERKE
jgi:DNA invertase Pin-like site-specific DNA recombinase